MSSHSSGNSVDEDNHYFSMKRKKRVQFLDDEDSVSDSTVDLKKSKLIEKNYNEKEFLESVLFESGEENLQADKQDDSIIAVDSSSPEKIEEPKETIMSTMKDNNIDYYTKNILDKMNFSESDDLDDFIEHDESDFTQKKPISNIDSRSKKAPASYMKAHSNDNIRHRHNNRSYQLALDVFGEEFDPNNFDFEKSYGGGDAGSGDNEYVSDDSENFLDDEASDQNYRHSNISSKRQNRRNIIKKSLHELFEPDELERRHLTIKDEEIRTKDVPERFQTRSNPVTPASDTELEQEANWIYDNYFNYVAILLTTEKREGSSLSTQTKSKNMRPNDVISCIKSALDLIRNELCEIPFILMYRHENINGAFNEDQLWNIYRADNKWYSFSNRIRQYIKYLKRFQNFQSETTNLHLHNFYYYLSERDFLYLETVKNETEFLNFYKKMKLYCDIYNNEFVNYEAEKNKNSVSHGDAKSEFTNEKIHVDIAPQKAPRSFNRHYFYINKNIDKVVTCFGLKPSDFDENIRVQYQKYSTKTSVESPCIVAKRYTSDVFDTLEKVLNAAVDMYVIELSHEQHIRKYIYEMFIKHARLNVSPTTNGTEEIDESHPYCSFKYIKNKPLKGITSELMVKLNQAKIDKLLIIKLVISDDTVDEIIEYLKSFQTISSTDESEYRSDWCDLRCKAIEKAVNVCLLPSVERDVYIKLLNEANEDLVKRCGDIFKNHLISSPYAPQLLQHISSDNYLNNDEMAFILVISVPPLSEIKSSGRQRHFNMRASRGNINHHSLKDKLNPINNMSENSIPNDDDGNSFSTMNCTIDQIGYAIVMDQYGEVVEYVSISNTILQQQSSKKNIQNENNSQQSLLNVNDNNNVLNDAKLSFKKIEKILIKYTIDAVFVPLRDREFNQLAINLNDRIRDMKSVNKPQVHLVNPYISNRMAKALKIADPTMNQAKVEYERTLSIGRYVLDPLVECANLFVSCDEILTLFDDLFLPYQRYLPKEKLKNIFEEKLVSAINEVGVDLNTACNLSRYSNLLQFVCGFGPRKAHRLLADVRAFSVTGHINNRTQLVTACNLGPKIFINCAGFFKIIGSSEEEGDIDLLDATRVHPELYDWARKIMVDALDIEDANTNIENTKKYDYNDMLETLRKDPSKLNDLDLDAFANELIRQGITLNKKYSLELITMEMLKEFPEYRPRYMPLSSAEKFWILANGGSRIDICETIEYSSLSPKHPSDLSRFHNEDLVPIYVGKYVSFIATSFIYKRPDSDEVSKAVPERDMDSQLWKCPFCFELISTDLKLCWDHIENVCPGNAIAVRGILEGFNGTLTGVISLVHVSDNPPKNIKERVRKSMQITCLVLNIRFDRLSIDLTCRTSDLCDKQRHCFKFRRDVYYDNDAEEKEQEIKKKKEEELKNKVVYQKKVIIHPSFKNISFSDAEKLLASASIGECIVRPSSKGYDHLTATWKVYNDIYQHIDILEMDKPNFFSLGKKLWIKGECYEDLDEIIARHINPMANLMKEAVDLKVFNYADGGSRHRMATILSEEKKGNPLRIPYIFSPSKIYPGKLLIGFLPRNTPLFEYVSITPDGLKFRDIIHNSFQELIKWFKQNFNQAVSSSSYHSTIANSSADTAIPLSKLSLSKTPNTFSGTPNIKNIVDMTSTVSPMVGNQSVSRINNMSISNQYSSAVTPNVNSTVASHGNTMSSFISTSSFSKKSFK